jgi:hypothetical protein
MSNQQNRQVFSKSEGDCQPVIPGNHRPIRLKVKRSTNLIGAKITGLDNVIKLALTLTLAAAMSGQLPRITNQIRHAQVKMLEKSKASTWGSPDLLHSRRGNRHNRLKDIEDFLRGGAT